MSVQGDLCRSGQEIGAMLYWGVINQLGKYLNPVLSLIYPPACLLCRQSLSTAHIYDPCLQKIPLCYRCQNHVCINRPPFCRKCSRPVSTTRESGVLCLTCQETLYYFDRAWGICIYNDAAKRLLHYYKYSHKTGLRHFYSYLLGAFALSYRVSFAESDWVVPIPLHPSRLRERGFNQSVLMAHLVGQEFGLPVSVDNLHRARNTKNQAKLSPKERWTNIQGAFRIKSSRTFCDKNILLIDDLYTTGSTVSEAARVLKSAGAKNVTVLTLHIAVLSYENSEKLYSA